MDTKGSEINIRRGFRQGHPLSPKIFITVLENIMKNPSWETKASMSEPKSLVKPGLPTTRCFFQRHQHSFNKWSRRNKREIDQERNSALTKMI